MMRNLNFIVSTAFLLVHSLVLCGQGNNGDGIFLYGQVKDELTKNGVADAIIRVVSDGVVSTDHPVTSDGKYEVDLDFDHSYLIRFLAPQYVSKFFLIDTRNVPVSQRSGGFGFDVDISLFRPVPGISYTLLDSPVGIAKYNSKKGEIAFDYDYTKRWLAQLEELKALHNKHESQGETLEAGNLQSPLTDGATQVNGSDDAINLSGIVTHDSSDKPIPGAKVTIWIDQRDSLYFFTTKKGEFQVELNSHHKYLVRFSAPEHISQSIFINATGIPKGSKGYLYNTTIRLPYKCSRINNSVFDAPVSLISVQEGKVFIDPSNEADKQAEILLWRKEYNKCRVANSKEFLRKGWITEKELESIR